jgi:uncharacterized protein
MQSSAVAASSSAFLALLSACQASISAPAKTGARAPTLAKIDHSLRAAVDASTGKDLIKLPPGFRYFSFGWAGEPLADGSIIPSSADGMGLVDYRDGRARFVRNQEIWDDRGVFALADLAFDVGAGGGAVTLDVDLANGKLLSARASLSGTNANCSGGVTPWGSWLSGEEQVLARGEIIKSAAGKPMTNFHMPHGFMFEVSGKDAAPKDNFVPLLEMGQMRHEAAAVDAKTGVIYLTEDNDPAAGLYRFTPNRPGKLRAGGKLEMLALDGIQDLRRNLQARAGEKFKAHWVPITDPFVPHADARAASDGCFQQGFKQGGAVFSRLEGIYMRAQDVFFTATNGGDLGEGQVFVYHADANTLELVYESTDKLVMTYPDAIEKGPAGGHIICQDGKEVFPQVLYFLSKSGKVTPIAQNNLPDHAGSHSEWSGCSMSPDGKWLFANVYTPGFSVAITGPFEQWAAAL